MGMLWAFAFQWLFGLLGFSKAISAEVTKVVRTELAKQVKHFYVSNFGAVLRPAYSGPAFRLATLLLASKPRIKSFMQACNSRSRSRLPCALAAKSEAVDSSVSCEQD